MGFLAKLFGTKQTKLSQQASIVPTLEISTSFSSYYVAVRQKTPGALAATSVSAWDGYSSPSGGYVNYGRFQVVGKNPITNRKNKRTYEARNEEEACKCAEAAGLLGPFEVSVLPALPPTDSQISYAKDLGATIPGDACKTDVSAIISRITDEDEEPASEHLARTAHECGVKFSRYHGRKAILALARDLPSKEYSKVLRAM